MKLLNFYYFVLLICTFAVTLNTPSWAQTSLPKRVQLNGKVLLANQPEDSHSSLEAFRVTPLSATQRRQALYNVNAEKIYQTLFPLSVEACTMTRYFKRGGDEGGAGGHAVAFLKGVCIDTSQGYQRLRLCQPDEVDPQDPDSGVGISSNQIFTNVAWIAIPGRNNFFHGGIGPEVELTEAVFQNTIDQFSQQPWFDSIEVRQRRHNLCRCQKAGFKNCFSDDVLEEKYEKYASLPLSDTELKRCIVEEAIGTDFGISMARSNACMRIPMPPSVMQKFISELNRQNTQAREEGFFMEWHF